MNPVLVLRAFTHALDEFPEVHIIHALLQVLLVGLPCPTSPTPYMLL